VSYLIDSNVVIRHLANDPIAWQLMERLAGAGIAVSTVTYMEAYQGILRDRNPFAEAALNQFVTTVDVIPFSLAIARRCAELREDLRQQGKRVRSRALDLLIAATALEHELTLVTWNARDYRDISGLQLWE
jgi:predicted nucleic acid-binding protein